jgi:hypothetical protein
MNRRDIQLATHQASTGSLRRGQIADEDGWLL